MRRAVKGRLGLAGFEDLRTYERTVDEDGQLGR
jgi:hypothetical protein